MVFHSLPLNRPDYAPQQAAGAVYELSEAGQENDKIVEKVKVFEEVNMKMVLNTAHAFGIWGVAGYYSAFYYLL